MKGNARQKKRELERVEEIEPSYAAWKAVKTFNDFSDRFIPTQLPTGRIIRVLTVDTFSRFWPADDPRFDYRGEDFVATLDRACRRIGYPKTIGVD